MFRYRGSDWSIDWYLNQHWTGDKETKQWVTALMADALYSGYIQTAVWVWRIVYRTAELVSHHCGPSERFTLTDKLVGTPSFPKEPRNKSFLPPWSQAAMNLHKLWDKGRRLLESSHKRQMQPWLAGKHVAHADCLNSSHFMACVSRS